MPNLGDFFTDEFKDNYANNSIKKGAVLKFYVTKTKPPKEKRFVVLGEDNDDNYLGVVFINSEINWKVINSDKLAELQLYIEAEDNDYLKWNSYIDCSEIYTLDKLQVQNYISLNPKNVLGNLKNEDLEQAIEYVKKSPKIPPKILKKFHLKE